MQREEGEEERKGGEGAGKEEERKGGEERRGRMRVYQTNTHGEEMHPVFNKGS